MRFTLWHTYIPLSQVIFNPIIKSTKLPTTSIERQHNWRYILLKSLYFYLKALSPILKKLHCIPWKCRNDLTIKNITERWGVREDSSVIVQNYFSNISEVDVFKLICIHQDDFLP